MKKSFLYIILIFTINISHSQIRDSLARCGRNSKRLIISMEHSGEIKYLLNESGNGSPDKHEGKGVYNSKYQRVELSYKMCYYLPALYYYRVEFAGNTLYIDNKQLQTFVDAYVNDSQITLSRYFNSSAFTSYQKDRKEGKDAYENDYCFVKLLITDNMEFKSGIAIRNLLEQTENMGQITNVDDNVLEIMPNENTDFIPDVFYYVKDKPNLRVTILKTLEGSFRAKVHSILEDDAFLVKKGDEITTVKEQIK
ncbi:hypothetical protein [Cellulophaga sp. Z1A5H]|uniref:hypothetical protein n=1 Tax=Cellulophaga sp. Z1A5H TaxID=2687291 RepID=UPI0013FD5913|nr:hypothetical protein [Cellulophaga sp. Z1A5H]